MSIQVKSNNIGISPRKVRAVCDLIRTKKASEALKILRFCEKKEVSLILSKLINSALSIASDSKKYDLENLMIGMVAADAGPTLKRIMPRAQGRAYKIRKRTSHITLKLTEK